MKVDPAGLAAAAARLGEALAAVAGSPVHPPLGADPASIGAAQRLSTAGAALAGSLNAQLAALIATAEGLGLISAAYVASDEANAATIANFGGGGPAPMPTGSAPPAPVLAPDVRAPLPPPPPPVGQAISAAVHGGDPAAGEPFSVSWSQVAGAAAEAAETVRSVIGRLPEVLDSPAAAPAVRSHLTDYANGFDEAARRAGALAGQAGEHANLRAVAGRGIPRPEEIAQAFSRWQQVAVANQASFGKYAVQAAQAESDYRALDTRAVSNYQPYHSGSDLATGGDPSSTKGRDPADQPGQGPPEEQLPSSTSPGLPGAGPGIGDTGVPGTEGTAGGTSPEGAGQLASMLPQMIPTVLGAAGGLLGGLTKVPESVMQGGMQAMQAATQGLSGLMAPKPDTTGGDPALGSDPSVGDPGLGDAGGGGGGGGEVTPAGGGPPRLAGTVTPSTGPPPTPPSMPTGGALPPPVAPAGMGGGGMPMGMPMGGMGGGQGGGARGEEPSQKKVVVPPRPHTESVTGKLNADRMAVSATAPDRDEPPTDDPPAGPRPPLVRRITMPPRNEDA